MNIRTLNTERDIETQKINIRTTAAQSIVTGYYGGKKVKHMASKTPSATKAGIHIVKNALRSRDIQKQLRYLPPEKRKQWNSYSYQKQTEILDKVEKDVIRKVERKQNSKSTSTPYHKNVLLQKELDNRATGYQKNDITMSDKWVVSVPKGNTSKEMRKNYRNGSIEKVTFYTDDIAKGAKQVKQIENRVYKREKSEKREGKILFLSSLLRSLDHESKKKESIQNLQKEDQISQMELENLASSYVTNTAIMPAKIKIQTYISKIMKQIGEHVRKILFQFFKMSLPILLPFLLIITILFATVTIIGGSSESGSGAISIGGGGYSATGNEIAEYALKWIGTPYVWGSTDLNVAVDCSGFTYSVYAHFDIQLPRTAREQGNYEKGQIVNSISDAIPGDLIWWTPNHVGIYIGNGQAVQSSGTEANYDLAHAGKGVCIVQADYRSIGSIRRYVTDVTPGEIGTGGHAMDSTEYTQEQIELIWAIVAQEDSASYEGALAVISTAMNRIDSPAWSRYGRNAYQQLTAPGQYCYSPNVGGNWQDRLNGNVPAFTKQAVNDCLKYGIRNHNFTCFRSTNGGDASRVKIGGNWYFN